MDIYRIVIISAVIGFSTTVFAEKVNSSPELNQPIDQILNSSFFRNAKLELSLRNHWKYLNDNSMPTKSIQSAWGQGIVLDYQSGYFANIIGFDATYYGVIKLAASDDFDGRGILYNKGTGNNKHNAEGFSKIGQRYVKLKYVFDQVKIDIKGGLQRLRDFGIISTSYHLSPTTYAGWSGNINYDKFILRGAYITSSLERNSPDKKKFKTQDKRDINAIMTTAFLYQGEQLSAEYAYGEANDYIRRHTLFLAYKPLSKLTLGTQIYNNKALSVYKSMSATNRQIDNEAWHYAIDAKWQEDKWSTKVGIAYTQANKANDVGVFQRHFVKNFRGTYISMAKASGDYLNDGELALSSIIDYKLTPELQTGLMLNYGQFHYKNNHIKRGEVNFFSQWTPQHPKLKNLNVFSIIGPGWSYKANRDTPILKNGKYSHSHSLGAEVLISYKFNIL